MDFNVFFQNLELPVIICDTENLIAVFVSDAAKTLLHVEETDDAIHLRDILKPKFANEFDNLIHELRNSSYVSNCGIIIQRGKTADISVTITGNTTYGHYCLFLTEAKTDLSKTGLDHEQVVSLLERVINNIDAMVYVADIKTCRVLYMNRSMARERGIKISDKEDIYCCQMFMRDAEPPCKTCYCSPLIADGKPTGESVNSEFKSTINNKWYSMTSCVVEWLNDEYVFLNSAVEITDRKNTEENLRKSATTDAMTNVYNRDWGYKALDKLINDVLESDSASSVVFIDIDGLKTVNDNYGHIEGDKIIIGVVDALKKCTRKNDIISRWGGDEFVVLLPCCSRINAETVMKNALSYLNDINKISVKPYKYSFSYGIYEISSVMRGLTCDKIIKTADALMYEQKSKKKSE